MDPSCRTGSGRALNKRKAAEQAAGGCRAGAGGGAEQAPGSAEQVSGGAEQAPGSAEQGLGGAEQAPGAVTSSGGMELSQSGGWSCHKLWGLRRPQLLGRKVG